MRSSNLAYPPARPPAGMGSGPGPARPPWLRLTLLAALSWASWTAACGPAPTPDEPAVDEAAAREEILETNRRVVELELAGDADGILALWTENAIYLSSDGILRGRPAIGSAAREFFRDHTVLELEIEPIEIRVFGDTAVELGTLEELVRGAAGEHLELSGSYMAVRVRRPDGTWGFHRFISSVRASPETDPDSGPEP